MRYILSFTLLASILVIASPALNKSGSNSVRRSIAEISAVTKFISHAGCLSDREVSSTLQTLSSAQTYSEQQQALSLLRSNAKRSRVCRERVISALVVAMDKPNLDLSTDQQSFYLWLYGSRLLTDLRAVEALDMLIAHLTLNDGTPFPLNHYPALGAVINMGEVALPKLEQVIRKNPDRIMRKFAAFCIASIGGRSAKRILMQANASESDQCVAAFIRASLNAFDNKTLPDHITSENRTKWYSTFLCSSK